MSEPNPNEANNPQQANPTVVYASPTKRTWAWVGVVYMVIILLLFTYFLAHGKFIQGIGGLMVVPALAGIASTALLQHKANPRRVPFLASLCTACICFALSFLCLLSGIPALLRSLGI